MNNKSIQDYFHFDETDLHANRNGTVSQKQHDRLVKNAGIRRKWGMRFGIVLIGITVCLILYMEKTTWSWTIGFFAGVTFLLGIYSMGRMFKRVNLKLEKAEGTINIVTVENSNDIGKGTVSTLHVGGQEFSVLSTLADYVTKGDACIVYFVRDSLSKRTLDKFNIMSMELLSQSK